MTDAHRTTDRQSCQHANTIDIGAWSWCKGCGSFHIDGEWCRPQYAPEPCGKRWYLASKNDGLFIIDTRPNTDNDSPHHETTRGPDMALNVTDLPQAKAQAIVDAHNARLSGEPREQHPAASLLINCLADMSAYLDSNKLNSICSESLFHQSMRDAIKGAETVGLYSRRSAATKGEKP